MRPSSSSTILRSLIALNLLATGSLCAQDAAGGKGPLSKLSVHGFLTQAYADAKSSSPALLNPTSDEIILGIPEDGTTDYRNLAIQFRYEISPKDIMIIQFSSRALGDSPIQDVEDEIELDWAFYERRLRDHTSVKVGRVQIPLGIFNEVRDVGVILPFYRPPFAMYREGSFTSETLDGVVFSHAFAPEASWSLDFDVYAGEWDLVETNVLAAEGIVKVARAEDAIGFQLWLNTPVSGLRFGLGAHQREVSGGQEGIFRLPGSEDRFDDYYISAEYAGKKFVGRAEFREFSADPNEIFIGGDFPLGYVQLGYHATERFRIYAQYEFAEAQHSAESIAALGGLGIPGTQAVDARIREDAGVALNYLFSPNVVLKLEHHFDISNEQFTFVPIFTPAGPFFQPIFATSEDGEYSILSLSASF